MDKTYVYKVYRGSTFLGVLQNVRSTFGFSQDINSAGSALNVRVAISPDTSGLAVEAILDEDGDPLLSESSAELLEESAPQVFGNAAANIQLRNGNRIDVYEYGSYHPNGKKMFVGIINKLEANFGSQGDEEIIAATLYSRGSDLDNYIIQDGI